MSFLTMCLISVPSALIVMCIIKFNGWDFWNDEEDRWN